MRHHDIERLKEAARRYAANKYTVGDMEELSEFACNALFEPPCSEKIRKVDNGDGAETWYGLPVVVPVGLIPDDETPVEVRSHGLELSGRWMNWKGAIGVRGPLNDKRFPGEFRLLLAAKPQLDLHTRLGRAIEALQELFDYARLDSGHFHARSVEAFRKAAELLDELREHHE